MARGDQADFVVRLQAVLPRWWPDLSLSPIYNGLLQGMASVLAQVFALLAYVRLQTRLLTSTDGWLDLTAYSFFGNTLPRKTNETDTAYRLRILASLFPERATRNGMIKALTTLTGRAPTIFEPGRAADCFVLGVSALGVGRLGSYAMPNQAFVTIYRSPSTGGANIAGLGTGYAGLGAPHMALADSSTLGSAFADADLYAAVDAQRPAGSIMWTRITS